MSSFQNAPLTKPPVNKIPVYPLLLLLLLLLISIVIIPCFKLVGIQGTFDAETINRFLEQSGLVRISAVCLVAVFTLIISTVHVMRSPRKVYLLDFACYKPSPAHMCSKELFMKLSSATGRFTEDSIEFQRRILEGSGFGQMTYVATGLLTKSPPDQSMAAARDETEAAMFGAIDDLLEKSGVAGREIKVLVVNCSAFSPTPSLSAAIVNRYDLREDVRSFHLGGMGCSAGLIAVDLARDLLQLLHIIHTNKASDDEAYRCIYHHEDHQNIVGVTLSKALTAVAGKTLKENITTLGPLVLSLRQKLIFLSNLCAIKVLGGGTIKPYVPDFKLAFEHFCIHAGGRGVLDQLNKSLDLTEWLMEPSRMTLYRFGNTSSSCLWYELAYCEAKVRVRKGNRVWQIGLGSGFKCNSAVWRALRNVGSEKKNPWADEIDGFPVNLPKLVPILN